MAELTSRRRSIPVSSDENPYWISFSDIMAGLLVIFILASVMLIMELSQRKQQIDKAIEDIQETNQIREKMLEEIVAELAALGIQVVISEDKTVIHIPEDALAFESRKYAIPRDKLDVVAAIGQTIYRAITTKERKGFIDTIFIEGHTDSRPARGFMEDLGNWGLSTARATSIWQYWSTGLEYSDGIRSLENVHGEPMFSVSGYADTRPLEPNDDTADKRRRNRRIDVRFSMKTPVLGDFENILESLDATSD